jgi:putative intracellular protease/amidase
MPGLEGRRIAVFAGAEGDALAKALKRAGALVELLSDGHSRSEADWHGGRYAAIVIGSGRDDALEGRVIQLVREFLLSGKPVVATGDGVALLEQAGGAREDALLVSENDMERNVAAVVPLLAERLEDTRLDEMSEQSFPASDPPATSPASIGAKSSRDAEAR